MPRTAGRAAPDVKRVLTQAELFSRASAAFVVLERTTSKGERLEPAAAFVAGHGRLFTSVAAVDGADVMTALLPDGKRQPITAMLAMHRAQDWIVLAGGPEGEISQPLASETTTQVGDRVFSLESSGGASRVLIDSSISGRAGSPASGPRLLTTIGSGSTPQLRPAQTRYRSRPSTQRPPKVPVR